MHLVDQRRLLDESLSGVQHAISQFESHLDKGNVMDAIQSASDMLRELRTSYLSPKSYYQLYIIITEELQLLESFLIEEHKNGRAVMNLYEIVQYNPCIVPRLYLLITVGVYQVKCNISRLEIMRDLVEMCCGVQHPVRGLFLRNYLLHALRSELLLIVEEPAPPEPDVVRNTTQTEADDNLSPPVWDTVNFLLFNFAEMNKLWVRMQHQGHSRDKERREQERLELRLLVGTNLNRLAELEAIDVSRYRNQILPFILEQLIECRDAIAQEYLLDVIVQVFPDEFHLATLPVLLETCNRLIPGVKPKSIICGLIGRLAQYTADQSASGGTLCRILSHSSPASFGDAVDESVKRTTSPALTLFNIFFDGVAAIINHRIPSSAEEDDDGYIFRNSIPPVEQMASNGLLPEDIPSIYATLVHLAALLNLDDPETRVNDCLNTTADLLAAIGINHVPPMSSLSRELLNLLHVPLGGLQQIPGTSLKLPPTKPMAAVGGIKAILNMSGFRRLVSILDQKTTKYRLARNLLVGALEQEQQQQVRQESASQTTPVSRNLFRLTCEEDVDNLFDLISVFFTAESLNAEDAEDFTEAQNLVAGAFHLLGPYPRTEDPDLCAKLLLKAQERLGQAGSVVIRLNYPALVFEALQVIQAFAESESHSGARDQEIERATSFVYQCITKLLTTGSADLALRLLLKSVLVIDRVVFSKREAMAYEFVSQALIIYEEWTNEARAQIDAMSLITGTLCQLRYAFGEDNRKTLRKQCTRAAAQLLRKPDQSRAVAATAHCYWPTRIMERDNKVNPANMIYPADKTGQQLALVQTTDDITDEDLKELRDGAAAVSCLDRAAKIADDCMDPAVRAQLLLDVLNHAVCLKTAGCPEVAEEWLNPLVQSVRTALSGLRPSPACEELNRYFSDTMAYLNGTQKCNVPAEKTDAVIDLFASVSVE